MTLQKTTLLISALATWCAQALYTVSPIDLIPDIIPILGLADDLFGFLLVLCFTGYTVYRLTRKERTTEPGSAKKKQQRPVHHKTPHIEYEPLTLDEIKAL